ICLMDERNGPALAIQRANFHWMRVQESRMSGFPSQALTHCEEAAGVFATHQHMINSNRFHTIIAGCANDLVEAQNTPVQSPAMSFPGALKESRETLRAAGNVHDLLADAQEAIAIAYDHAQYNDDLVGLALADMEEARYDRLKRSFERRETNIGKEIAVASGVLTLGRQMRDVAVQGQARTMIGDALWADGNTEAARNQYYAANALLRNAQLGGLALRPQRALQMLDTFTN
ncbi:MAG TPA: hypothetical protein VKQ36_14790, partial [Ktedonobacterales bacterium]|nr:hypothetical protein [Ktedonobacterales bacterium]